MKAITKLLAVVSSVLLSVPALAVETVYFYHTDPAGTPLAMTNADGAVVWQADYLPFGEIQQETSFAVNDRKLVGKEKDPETGLYYFGARYMEARIGRFMSPDPVGPVDPKTGGSNSRLLRNPQLLNSYAYALNNPYRYIDPDGETVWDVVDVISFGYSLYTFANDPTLSNAGDLALDTVGLLPVVPALGTIKRVGEGLNKIDDAIDAERAARGAGRSFDDVLGNLEAFTKWLKHSHPTNKPLSAKDAQKVWDKLLEAGKNPRLDPGHRGTKWDMPHINVDGSHIPVDAGFAPPVP